QSFTGLAGHLATEHIDWQLAAMVSAAAVVGAVVGGRLAGLVDANALRRLFGWFVLLMASLILAEETTPAIGVTAAAVTAIAAVAYVMCGRTTHCPLRRLAGQPHISAATT